MTTKLQELTIIDFHGVSYVSWWRADRILFYAARIKQTFRVYARYWIHRIFFFSSYYTSALLSFYTSHWQKENLSKFGKFCFVFVWLRFFFSAVEPYYLLNCFIQWTNVVTSSFTQHSLFLSFFLCFFLSISYSRMIQRIYLCKSFQRQKIPNPIRFN